jgi:glyoxylase-like metal-dependent hydrolase (beta-lactamase superfamily II)
MSDTRKRILLSASWLCCIWLTWMATGGFQQSSPKDRIAGLVTTANVFTGYDENKDVREARDTKQPLVQITSEIYQVAGFRGLVSAVYLVRTPQPILIDSGSRYGTTELERNLKQLGLSIGDIALVIGTHGHWDHIDGVSSLVGDPRFKGKFALHEADVKAAESNDRVATAAGTVYRLESAPVKVQMVLKEGPLTVDKKKFYIYHTPGHTPGSISLLVESDGLKILFVGDSVKGWYLPRGGSDMVAWEKSLTKLLAVDFDLALEGHGQRYKKNIVEEQLQLMRRDYLTWATR